MTLLPDPRSYSGASDLLVPETADQYAAAPHPDPRSALSASCASLFNVRKNLRLCPLNRFEAVSASTVATAPASLVELGRITEQVGKSRRRKTHRFGMTCSDSCLPSVRSGTTSVPSELRNSEIPPNVSSKIA